MSGKVIIYSSVMGKGCTSAGRSSLIKSGKPECELLHFDRIFAKKGN
jgi:hypothetical protein